MSEFEEAKIIYIYICLRRTSIDKSNLYKQNKYSVDVDNRIISKVDKSKNKITYNFN